MGSNRRQNTRSKRKFNLQAISSPKKSRKNDSSASGKVTTTPPPHQNDFLSNKILRSTAGPLFRFHASPPSPPNSIRDNASNKSISTGIRGTKSYNRQKRVCFCD